VRAMLCGAAVVCVMTSAVRSEDDGGRAVFDKMSARFLERYGMASAIETACPGYEAEPALQAGLKIFGEAYRDKRIILLRAAEATAAAAAVYDLKAGHMQFCMRALAAHGPESDDALVVRKRAK
jgi:hypothetical protein